MQKLSSKPRFVMNKLKSQLAKSLDVGSSNPVIDKMLKSQRAGGEYSAMASRFPNLAEQAMPTKRMIGPAVPTTGQRAQSMFNRVTAPLRDNPTGLTGRPRLKAKLKARKLRRNIGAGAATVAAAGIGGKMLHSAMKARKAKSLLRKRVAIGGAAGAAGLGAALASRRR